MLRLTGTNEEISKILYEEQLALNTQNVNVEETVREIIADVAVRGDLALCEYSRQFDGVDLVDFEVSQAQIEAAFAEIDEAVLVALENAKANIESYHRKQLETGFEDTPSPGVIRGQLVRPLERVGVYVPGGTAAYPSSVLMNVIPAKIAGVEEIIMITPPQAHFEPAILVAAKLAGVDKIYQVGGAQGVAALAYGTKTIPKVDKITGPGNIYVATAKKQVYGLVGIDMIAGPSEIGIIADETANPVYVAADLLSQAEHDKLARVILVTNSETLAQKVELEIEKQLQTLPREDIARGAIENNGRVIIADSVADMFDLMNKVAPEHLEVAMETAYDYLPLIKNAGSIFLGHYTSEPIGDYYAGTNHVLPTSGTSRFYSALGVYDFIKRMQYTHYSKEAVNAAEKDITALAYSEGLAAHARAIEVRNEKVSGLLVMDVDSTLIMEEGIDLLGTEAGVGQQVAEITERAMQGELDFEAALRERVALLKGLPRTIFETIAQQIHFTPGAKALVDALHARGYKVGIVSGGFHETVDALAEALGLDFVKANHLEIKDGQLTGQVSGPIVTKDVKVQMLEAWAAQLGLDLSDTIAMGDGANDLPMIQRAGIGVAFCAKPIVRAQAPYQINEKNLYKLLDIIDEVKK